MLGARGLVPLAIILGKGVDHVPAEVIARLRMRLRDIKRTLDTVPRDSAEWASVLASGMLLELDGWRFQYRIETRGTREAIMVEGARLITKP
jgi:hypothetical protein